ncbi:hypothetical protein [Polynucleobacter sp. MWH-Berg-3C6]|uniref:hypothetical protein n=1 Tax=Polynucleobacter sp. MWH-Berg-3C6 TaxID=1855882 RepID=UPI001C0B8248|nr:hypothetical protein [Polynucleobacter sp. MWH-Berg-3C6]MBU3549897.1 hypothetical protein [Polynucleobacter sp. MWH-Berg-3C6]
MLGKLFKYELLGKALNAVQIFITLKVIEPEDFSRVNLSISYILFIQVLSEFSFGRYQQSKNIDGVSKSFIKSICIMSTLLLTVFCLLAYKEVILIGYLGLFLSGLLIYTLPLISYLHQTTINSNIQYFAKLKLASSAASFTGFLLALFFGLGATSYFVSMLTSSLILLASMATQLKFNENISLNKSALFYCSVTTLTGIFAWTIQYLDLTILREKISSSDMGSYGLANNIAITIQAIGLASIVPIYSKAFSTHPTKIKKYFEYFLRSSVNITFNLLLYVLGVAILLAEAIDKQWNNVAYYIVICVCLKSVMYQMGVLGDYLRIRYGVLLEFLLMIFTSLIIFTTGYFFNSIEQIFNIRIFICMAAILAIVKIYLKKLPRNEMIILALIIFSIHFFGYMKASLLIGVLVLMAAIISDFFAPKKISLIKRLVLN